MASGAEAAPASPEQLLLLHDRLATWLSDEMPLYVPGKNPTATYEGFPLAERNVAWHGLYIPGDALLDTVPEASRALKVVPDDKLEVQFHPVHYIYEPGDTDPPSLTHAFTSVDLLSPDPSVANTRLAYFPGMCREWSGSRGEGEGWPTSVEITAFHTIASSLSTIRDHLRATDRYPDDWLAYCRELAVKRSEQQVTQELEHAARRAAKERLLQTPTLGPLDSDIIYALTLEQSRMGRAYAIVPHADIDTLRQAVLSGLLRAGSPLYEYDDYITAAVTPAFHERQRALRTTVTSLVVMAQHTAAYGPAAVFTVGKDVVMRDGVSKREHDTFAILDNRYVRTRSITSLPQFTHGERIDGSHPMTRPQHGVFMQLAALIGAE